VLGCTEYELAAQAIAAALPGVSLHGSASAVAAQALRRALAAADHDRLEPGHGHAEPVPSQLEAGPAKAALRVLLSGRPGDLPPAAFRYREGRSLEARSASVRA
ncbi:MAG TPA: hypothetical protein VK162_11870, partial [Streptosporangiaceae bacterium]|nr:hypothetical protein [Streptosporangiaceae bacterium]